jgi:small-conductance mechanosensitive channel
MEDMLSAAPACLPGQDICHHVMTWTGDQRLADIADDVIGKPLVILALVLIALVVRWLAGRVIDRVVARAELGVLPERLGAAVSEPERRVQRARTIGGLLKSVVSGVLVAVVGTMILSELGVDIAPIIASAGIIGVALGFGAQSLVRDFLSGIFMIFEDQYGVGDVVDLGEAQGTVEAVSLRITRVRDGNGSVWYVPNGSILRVANKSQNWARAVVDVPIPFDADVPALQRLLVEVAQTVWEDDELREDLIEAPEVTGLESLDPATMVMKVMIKTRPMKQWEIARILRQRIKGRMDGEGFSPPGQRVVWKE